MNPPFGTPWGGKDAPEGQERVVREQWRKGGRFERGLPGTGDAQLLFMQHAINKLDKNGRAAIISNGSPLFSGGTTSGESQIRRWMLEEDLLEAIIALPTQLFYNTDIGIYVFVLSRNKRAGRKGKVQLINAVDMWKPLRKSLGKKRREIDKDSMVRITKLYANFAENKHCKIFPNEEFMYKEYAVYQPLQRKALINAESIEKLRTSAYFTSNSSIFNETDFKQLREMSPRSSADEKKYQKYLAGQKFVADVLAALELNCSEKVYWDYSEFEKRLKTLLSGIDGYSASRLTGIAMILSEMDKSAVVSFSRYEKHIPNYAVSSLPHVIAAQDMPVLSSDGHCASENAKSGNYSDCLTAISLSGELLHCESCKYYVLPKKRTRIDWKSMTHAVDDRERDMHEAFNFLLYAIERVRKGLGYQESLQSSLLRYQASALQYGNALVRRYETEEL